MTLDRSIPPQIHQVDTIKIPHPIQYQLDNGITVSEINKGTQDVVRIEVLYDASRPVEDKQLASRYTATLMREGTANYDSKTIAEKIDYYGATLNSGSNMDFSYCTLFVLSRYVEATLPYLQEIMFAPIFNESELEKFRINQLEKLKDNLAKSDLLAFRKITEEMYGADQPYGYNSSAQNIEAIAKSDLHHHFDNYHTNDRCHIVISGKMPNNIRSILNKYLGQIQTNKKDKIIRTDFPSVSASKHLLPSDQTHQTAIKIGRRMFNRAHPDFANCFMMTTVLGGYFGSRLMERIREELGYTYNIYASLDPLVYDGYLTINTEVSNDLADKTVEEIKIQIDQLRQEKISKEEMTMVRNYIMGNFLNMVDGPFRIANFIKTLTVSKLQVADYEKIIAGIQSCTPEDILLAAQRYLNPDDLIEVRVGSQY